MQITRDLVSFWNEAYVQVKKELKGRYPKHYWPDNPLEAEPTTKTKKQMDRQAAATKGGSKGNTKA